MGFQDTYNRFIQYLDDAFAIMEMARQSVWSADSRVEMAETMLEFHTDNPDMPGMEWTPERFNKQHDLIDKFKKEAAFARKEIDSGFPILNAHETVGLWGALEALIDDVAVDMLIEWPDRLSHERFQKLKIPLAQYMEMDEGDRVRFLLDEAIRVPAKDPSAGIARFEVMMDLLGLPPFADSERRMVLIEMHGARNLIVHRASVVDRRFLDGCPWVDLRVGDRFIVDGNRYMNYRNAVFAYVAHVRESILAERRSRTKGPAQSCEAKKDSAEMSLAEENVPDVN